MTATPTKFYAYAIVDTRVTPPKPVELCLTRAAARLMMNGWGTFAGPQTHRIRRVKCTLFES